MNASSLVWPYPGGSGGSQQTSSSRPRSWPEQVGVFEGCTACAAGHLADDLTSKFKANERTEMKEKGRKKTKLEQKIMTSKMFGD